MSLPLRITGCFLGALALLLAYTSHAQVPGVTWANGGGAPRATYSRQAQARGAVADAAGNTYVTGIFRDTLALGSIRLVSTGDYDVYVAKLNADGEYQWAAQATGNASDLSNGIALDNAGNVYITGYTEGAELNFGSQKLTNPGYGGALYVAQLSPTGAWQRVTLASSSGYTFSYTVGNALVVDGTGAVYVTGGLNGRVQFGATTLTNGGSYGTFVAKLSPGGTWQWATIANGSYDFGNAIALDQAGNPYITGTFESRQATFGAFTLTNSGSGDIFVAKLTAAGAWQWVAQGGGRYNDGGRGIAVDLAGNAYVTGAAAGDALRFGPLTFTKPDGSTDLFVAKLDATGTWQWVSLGGGAGQDYGVGILLRGDNLTVAGTLGSPTVRFGALPPITVGGEADAGIVRLGTDGQWQWALGTGGAGNEYPQGLAAGPQEEVRVVGTFEGKSTSFGATTLVGGASLDDKGKYFADAPFVLAVADLAQRSPASLTLWPNPSQGTVYATGLEPGQPVQVFDSRGRLVASDARPAYEVQGLALPKLAAGLYILRCGPQTQKFILY
jgi:hypothetical protein